MEAIKEREDIEKIREYLRKNYNFGDMYALMFTLGCNFGLRASDLRKITYGDIRNKTHLEILEKKTGKYRKMFINGKVRNEFDKYVEGHRYNNAVIKVFLINDSEPLFMSRKNNELDEKSIYRIIRTACESIKLKGNYGSHTMRKTFAYHCYKMVYDLNVLKRLLMHSDVFVTKRYIDMSDELIDIKNGQLEVSQIKLSDDEIYSSLNL